MAENLSSEQAAAMQKQNCIFCKIIKGEIPSKKVHEDNLCVAVLDINPANEGHVILLPKEHYAIMPQVPKEVLSLMAAVTKKISKALLLSTLGKSTSIFVANGAVAGQKAPHFMIHIIPRKVSNEFFEIPQKPTNTVDLDKVKEILILKLEAITGKKLEDKAHHIPATLEDTPIQKEIIHNAIVSKPVADDSEEIEEIQLNPRKLVRVGIKKEKGFLYYIDEDGDVARAPMARGRKKGGKKEKVKVFEEKEIERKKEEKEMEDNNSETANLDDISRMLLGGRQ